MASTDARPIPIKNTAFRAVFPILDADGDLVTGATGLDSEVSKDQGTFADCTNEATEIATSSGMYYLDLTSTEMNADCVAVIVKTSSSGAKTTVLVFYPEEAGDINVDVTAWNGTAVPGVDTAGYPKVTIKDGTGTGEIDTSSGKVSITDGAITSSTFASGAITAAAIAADAITDAKVASDVTIASVTGAVGSVTGNVGGNVTGSVGSVAAGGITASSIAADAIGASELAADAATEIATAVWAAATRTLTALGFTLAAADLAADTITAAKVAADVTTEIQSGLATAAELAKVPKSDGTATWNATALASLQQEATDALNAYDPPTRTEATSDKDAILTILGTPDDTDLATDIAGVANSISSVANGVAATLGTLTLAGGQDGLTIGGTGNDTTHIHLPTLGYGDDELNNLLLVIIDQSTARVYSTWISDWVNSTKLATVNTLPFTPQDSTDTVWVLSIRQDVTGGSGLDAAGVRAAIGLASANLDTQLAAIDDAVDTEVAAILADTNELQTDWANGGRLDLLIDAIKAKTDNLPSDPADASDIAASFSTVNTKLDAIDDYVDSEVAAIKAKTDNLPSDPADASDIAASFSTVNSTLSTIAGYIDTEVAAIKAKTDNLPAAPAAVGDIPTAVQNADALLGRNINGGSSTGRTVKQALRALRNKVTRSGGTITVYQEDDTTSDWTASYTTDDTAEPIVTVDPS